MLYLYPHRMIFHDIYIYTQLHPNKNGLKAIVFSKVRAQAAGCPRGPTETR